MKALVLAAGRGERLLPLSSRVAKPLLAVGGRPLIHYVLLMLRGAGVTEVAVNVHHLAPQIQLALGDGRALGMSITYFPETVLLGTGGPLLRLREFFGGEPFVIANSDTVLDLELARMIAFHRQCGALATLALFRPHNLESYSRVEIDSARRVRRMRLIKARTKGQFDSYPQGLVQEIADGLDAYMYCGVTICEAQVVDRCLKQPPFSLMGEVIGPVVAAGLPVFGYVHTGYFATVDDEPSYEKLRAEFAENPPPLSYL